MQGESSIAIDEFLRDYESRLTPGYVASTFIPRALRSPLRAARMQVTFEDIAAIYIAARFASDVIRERSCYI